MDVLESLNSIRESIERIDINDLTRADTYSYSKVFKITSTDSKKNHDKPNHTLKNPKQSNVSIKALSLIFDDTFQTKGLIQIVSDGNIFVGNRNGR